MRLATLSFLLLLVGGCGKLRESPLTRALQSGDQEQIQLAIARSTPEERHLALISSARSGNAAAIPILVKAGVNPGESWGVNDWSPLEHAVHKRQLTCVRALLDAGARVDQRDRHGRTALRWAAANGFPEITKLLLERGADPHIADHDDVNALDAAMIGIPDIDNFTIGHCQTDTVRAIMEKAPDMSPSAKIWNRVAVKLKHCTEIKQLVSKRLAQRN